LCPCLCPTFSRKSWEKSGYWFDETLTSTEDHDFWIGLSRHTDFHPIDFLDCECSYRTDKTSQMTGSVNFVPNWIKVFKKWRHTATPEKLNWVIESQNNILKSVNVDPMEYDL
jgi:hypothetical protein